MKKLGVCLMMVLGVLLSGTGLWAEELKFPTTEAEIIEALGSPPPAMKATPKGRGALKSTGGGSSLFGNTRGLGAIVDDEASLQGAPKVGALILFDYDSDVIKDESFPLLKEYGKALQGALKEATMIVAGHTDSKGSEQYNLTLSQRRAEAVKRFLMSEFQLAEARLIVKPYGETKPIATNSTDDGRAKNRRVEFIRIK